jgi:hypothetical protein
MKRKTIACLVFIAAASVPEFLPAQPAPAVDITKASCKIVYEPVFVLQQGTDNVINIRVQDSAVKRLLVNASQGTVRQDGEDFIIHPEKKGEVTLDIYNYNDLSHPVLIDKRTLQVISPVSSPVASLAGKRGGNISKEELLLATKIELSGAGNSMRVQEFKLSVAGKGINSRNDCLPQRAFCRRESLY